MGKTNLTMFKHASLQTSDPFWQQVLSDMALNKFPKGMYVHDDHVYCKIKNREFMYKYKDKTADEIALQLCDLVRQNLYMVSIQDHSNNMTMNQGKLTHDDSPNSWTAIKKKSMRETIILKFVLSKCNEHDFSRETKSSLFNSILLHILFKDISHNDILYNDNQIHSINGLTFHSTGFVYHKPRTTSSSFEKVKPELISLEHLWEKYISSIGLSFRA